MPSYEEDLSEFERRNAQVLGISTDQVFSSEAWAKSMGGLSYPLLSDHWPHGYVAALYGVLRGDSGVCERAIFVVGADGMIAYVDVHDISEQPPTDKIMEALDRLPRAGGAGASHGGPG
jgi:peroxiredoxin